MIRFIGRMRNRLPKGRFVRSVTLLTGGTVIGQATALLSMPLLTRLYSPGDFGLLAVFVALVSILSVVSSLRFEMAIPLPSDEETATDLLALSLLILTGLSLFAGIGVWTLGDDLAALMQAPALATYLWLLPFGIFGAGAFQVLGFWAIRKKTYKSFAVGKLNQSVVQATSQVGLGMVAFGPLGLLLGDVLGRTGGSISLAAKLFGTTAAREWRGSLAGLKNAAKRYWRFPLFSSPSSIINAASAQMPTLFIAVQYGAGAAGAFALAQKVIKGPAQAIIQSISQVFLGEASRLAHDGSGSLDAYYHKIVKASFALSLVPCLVLASFAPLIITTIFGDAWQEAGAFARIIAIVLIAEITISSTSQITSITQSQHLQLVGDVVRLILTGLALVYTWHSGLSAVGGYTLLGGATLAAYGFYYLLYRSAIRNHAASRPPGPEAPHLELESHT